MMFHAVAAANLAAQILPDRDDAHVLLIASFSGIGRRPRRDALTVLARVADDLPGPMTDGFLAVFTNNSPSRYESFRDLRDALGRVRDLTADWRLCTNYTHAVLPSMDEANDLCLRFEGDASRALDQMVPLLEAVA